MALDWASWRGQSAAGPGERLGAEIPNRRRGGWRRGRIRAQEGAVRLAQSLGVSVGKAGRGSISEEDGSAASCSEGLDGKCGEQVANLCQEGQVIQELAIFQRHELALHSLALIEWFSLAVILPPLLIVN